MTDQETDQKIRKIIRKRKDNTMLGLLGGATALSMGLLGLLGDVPPQVCENARLVSKVIYSGLVLGGSALIYLKGIRNYRILRYEHGYNLSRIAFED